VEVPHAVVVFDKPGDFDILDDPVEVFVVVIDVVVVFVVVIDFVIKAELVCVLDAAMVLEAYGEEVLVFDGAPENVGIYVIKEDDVKAAVFVAARDGTVDLVPKLLRVEVLLDVGLSVGITNPSRSMRLL